jgi:hypothetical protein
VSRRVLVIVALVVFSAAAVVLFVRYGLFRLVERLRNRG